MTLPSAVPNLQFQLDINDQLLSLETQIKIEPSPEAKLKHSIFLALFYKSFATARAIRLLCDHSLYGDAFALLRVLVEGVINAIYILKSDDRTAQDYMAFPRFQAWHQFELICKVAPQLADYVPQQEQKDMKADFEQVRSRYEKNRIHIRIGQWGNMSNKFQKNAVLAVPYSEKPLHITRNFFCYTFPTDAKSFPMPY